MAHHFIAEVGYTVLCHVAHFVKDSHFITSITIAKTRVPYAQLVISIRFLVTFTSDAVDYFSIKKLLISN